MSPDGHFEGGYHPILGLTMHRHFCKTISVKQCMAESQVAEDISMGGTVNAMTVNNAIFRDRPYASAVF